MSVIEIVHFNKERQLSSKLTIDADSPKTNQKGYPEAGGFWLRLQITGQAMRLSLMEAIELKERLSCAIIKLIEEENILRAQLRK